MKPDKENSIFIEQRDNGERIFLCRTTGRFWTPTEYPASVQTLEAIRELADNPLPV